MFIILFIFAIGSIGVMASYFDFEWVIAYSIFIGLSLLIVRNFLIKKR